jgi:acyl-CoA synthetase (AMP-forming)/AMP-acid ligase II
VHERDTCVVWDWGDWRPAAYEAAASFQAGGLGVGARVGAVLSNTADACALLLGTWLAGTTLISLPTRARALSPERYLKQFQQLCQACRPDLLWADRDFLSVYDTAWVRDNFAGPSEARSGRFYSERFLRAAPWISLASDADEVKRARAKAEFRPPLSPTASTRPRWY